MDHFVRVDTFFIRENQDRYFKVEITNFEAFLKLKVCISFCIGKFSATKERSNYDPTSVAETEFMKAALYL